MRYSPKVSEEAKVDESDMLAARERYSRYVFASILAEDDPDKRRLESVLYEFAGAPRVVKRTDAVARILRANVASDDVLFYLRLLCDLNFLGIQTSDGFRFSSDENDRHMLMEVAMRLAAERGWGEESYEVNPAFYQALQIE